MEWFGTVLWTEVAEGSLGKDIAVRSGPRRGSPGGPVPHGKCTPCPGNGSDKKLIRREPVE